MEFKVDVPGSYKLVDHSILRAFNKGALGELKVEGPEAKAIYSGKQAESDYQAKGGTDRPSLPWRPPTKDIQESRGAAPLQDLLHGVSPGRRTGDARARFRRSRNRTT